MPEACSGRSVYIGVDEADVVDHLGCFREDAAHRLAGLAVAFKFERRRQKSTLGVPKSLELNGLRRWPAYFSIAGL